jgi:steroid 5-alpha reductase family enzyme
MSAGQIRKCGMACVLWGLMKFAWMLVPLVIANAYNKEPTEGTSLVVIGLVIVVISWVMEMAAEMQEERELIV